MGARLVVVVVYCRPIAGRKDDDASDAAVAAAASETADSLTRSLTSAAVWRHCWMKITAAATSAVGVDSGLSGAQWLVFLFCLLA